jgi:hypothetical protein
LEEIIFENFSIFENNIINVELAKVLGYMMAKKNGEFVYNILPKLGNEHKNVKSLLQFLYKEVPKY